MEKDQYIALAGKLADGTASEQEIALYNAYFNAYQIKYPMWSQLSEVERTDMLNEAEQNIHEKLKVVPAEKKTIKLWPRVAVAAAAVAAITLGTWLYINEHASPRNASRNEAVMVYDIEPGKNTATLTLPNGKTIKLSDTKTGVVIDAASLKYNDGTNVDSSQNITKPGQLPVMQMLTATTPRGGTYQVILPDKSKVWLNADSKISFPSQFNGRERKILLEGEAYFEVAASYASLRGRRTKQPFVVETNRQTIEVLGTHFNVSAYTEEREVMTTLIEGKVKVTGDGNTLTLDPGGQAYSGVDGIRGLKTEDPEAEIAWKNGQFVFADEDVESIMRKVARWYDVKVVYQKGFENKYLVGTISKFENVSKVLKMLELTGTVHFKVEGRRITVMR